MSRSLRLFDLLQVLRRHRWPVSGAALARESGVSLRTLRRDMATLQAMGVDIDAAAGVGYSLRPSAALPSLSFTAQELRALTIGAEWVAHQTDPALARAVRVALAKIESALAPSMRDALDGSSFYVGDADLARGTAFDPAPLLRAIREQRKLRVAMRKDEGSGHAPRVEAAQLMWPVMLRFDGEARGLAGWCEHHQAYQIVEVDRLATAEVLDERFTRPRSQMLKEWRAVAAEVCEARNRR